MPALHLYLPSYLHVLPYLPSYLHVLPYMPAAATVIPVCTPCHAHLQRQALPDAEDVHKELPGSTSLSQQYNS